jgi:predicted DNA-binding helix-hairpin-helix protein
MDPVEKLKMLGDATRHEPAGDEVPVPCPHIPAELVDSITHVVSPHNRQMPVLKAVVTTACRRDCAYCGMRAGRDTRRITFSPDELADGCYRLYRAGLVEGLFLSSGILRDGVCVQDKIIATAEILRRRFSFQGYIHLKVMPGAEYDQVVRTMQLADRVSVNLEAPTPDRLERIAPGKGFMDELLQRLRWIEEIRQGLGGRGPSSTTQFVVGAAEESDLELLQTTHYLHQQVGLKRAYFSPFSPIPDTPLENAPPTSPERQHRLYQSSYLLRDYHFDVEELPFEQDGNLPLNQDPKLAWAREYLIWRPVELNRAGRRDLLRVPGIGPKGADRILRERRRGTLRNLEELRKIGVWAERAAPFVLLDGRRPPVQLPLFGR